MADLRPIIEKIGERRALGRHTEKSPQSAPPAKPGLGTSISRYPTASIICVVTIVGALAIAALIPFVAAIALTPPGTGGSAAAIQPTGPVTVAPAVRAGAAPGSAPGAVAPSAAMMDARSQPTGTLSGIIRFEGTAPVAGVLGTPTTGPPVIDESLLVDPQTKGIANVVVYLARPPAGAAIPPAPELPAAFGMSGATYVPHIVVARTGEEIVATNRDPVLRGVHSWPLRNDAINAVVPPAFAASWKFAKPETRPVKITSDCDPWMSGWVVVLDHPWVAVSDRRGAFTIPGLPSGAHEFTIWHEWSGGIYLARKLIVEIDIGKTTELEFSIPASRFGR